jgi:hypothetical protein
MNDQFKSIITKVFITVFLITLLILLFLFVTQTVNKGSGWNLPIQGVSFKVVVNQDKQSKLALKEITIVKNSPSDYKLEMNRNFYSIRIMDKKGKVLFAGKVTNRLEYMPIPPLPGEKAGKPIFEVLPQFTLYLPIYNNAVELVLLDESGNIKLKLDLASYQKSEEKKILDFSCGNAVCDSNENLFNCFKDCFFKSK